MKFIKFHANDSVLRTQKRTLLKNHAENTYSNLRWSIGRFPFCHLKRQEMNDQVSHFIDEIDINPQSNHILPFMSITLHLFNN